MGKSVVYIVVEIGWEYNDEWYYIPESEGYLNKKAFKNKDNALAECKKLTLDYLSNSSYGVDLLSYCPEWDLKTFQEWLKPGFSLEEILKEMGWDSSSASTKHLNEGQLEKLYECFELPFFKVIEIDIEN